MRLLFLLSIAACFQKSDSEDEERDDANNETEEGSSVGDCLDGEDNDDDGAIDCEDAGCFDKPACQSEDTDTDQTEPLGVLFSGTVTEWGSIEDYVYETEFTPIDTTIDAQAQADCPDCVLWGRINERFEAQTDEGFLAIDANDQLHLYRLIQGYWFKYPNLDSEEYCDETHIHEVDNSSYYYECVHLSHSGDDITRIIEITW